MTAACCALEIGISRRSKTCSSNNVLVAPPESCPETSERKLFGLHPQSGFQVQANLLDSDGKPHGPCHLPAQYRYTKGDMRCIMQDQKLSPPLENSRRLGSSLEAAQNKDVNKNKFPCSSWPNPKTGGCRGGNAKETSSRSSDFAQMHSSEREGPPRTEICLSPPQTTGPLQTNSKDMKSQPLVPPLA